MCKGKRLSVSAGDLLGKTHEELVLLLIQLRRNQTKILRAKEKLEKQIESLQEFPQSNNGRQPAYQNKKELQKQILLLQKQYEDTQPLVTLVDNMVKLGSLYGSSNRRSFSLPLLDTSQEDVSSPVNGPQSPDYAGESNILSKLLAEESNFQKRISEIYSLDKGLRNETNSISSLHQDKEMLEYTLSGMRNKILDHQDRPSELQKLKKQQKMIEKELVRVKRLLSTSAKKIEDAASKNDQMEKDILHLRQILKEALKTGSSEAKDFQHNRADIEAELSRVQNVLDELANHRHEINNTVMKLKGEAPPSSSVGSEYKASPSGTAGKETHLLKIRREPESSTSPVTVTEEKEVTHLKKVKKGVEVRASPTGVAGSAPLPVRKKQHSMYLETDLDTMETRDLASVHEKDLDDIPVYVNAEEINNPNEEIYENFSTIDYANMATYNSQSDGSATEQCAMQDINDADERMKRFYGIIPKEKPSEIKTVRIVKRQSERRNRERDKKRVTYDDQSSVWVVEEPDISSDDLLDVDEGVTNRNPPTVTRPSSIHLLTSTLNRQSNSQSAHERLFGTSAPKPEKSTSNGSHDRSYTTKRSKRRHYTVSGYQYALDPQFSQYFKDQPRSRDDVDMERCLRTANTPDIVRSTIKKNDVFDDKIIERELMLPQKIEIPERYVEIEPEQLSASERLRRSIKAENICKMLSETTTTYEDVEERSKSPEALHKKLSEEKRKRAHLLNLNRAIAREVVEKSKAVAANVCSAENQTST
ncbi:Pleckstrin homology domain-containing family [Argiope bruennichi]|uniref:Pleckstrin homology domain-containing family n=1 Tax=Argiope bruennichi TaxID=94029 RepID=A0A8T0FCV8_ARGBR|nr:Pleckstrin homology domain-containing family [Argiope bruennichi]